MVLLRLFQKIVENALSNVQKFKGMHSDYLFYSIIIVICDKQSIKYILEAGTNAGLAFLFGKLLTVVSDSFFCPLINH